MSLESKLQPVVDEAQIEAGIAVTQVETGEQFEINGSRLYPMASVFKIPVLTVAGQQLARASSRSTSASRSRTSSKARAAASCPFSRQACSPPGATC